MLLSMTLLEFKVDKYGLARLSGGRHVSVVEKEREDGTRYLSTVRIRKDGTYDGYPHIVDEHESQRELQRHETRSYSNVLHARYSNDVNKEYVRFLRAYVEYVEGGRKEKPYTRTI